MQDRPLLRQVLARRQPRRVVAGVGTFFSAFDLNTLSSLGAMAFVTPRAARRPRAYVRVKGPDAVDYLEPDALERRAGRGLGRRAAADAEGARDRAAARVAARRRRRAAADRAGARRGRSARSSCACASPRSARSSPRSTPRRSSSRRRTGSRTATTACRRSRCSTPASTRTVRKSSSGCASRRRRRASAASSTTACCRPRRGSRSARSRSPRAAIPGQEPVARQHHRGKVNRRLRVLDVDGAARTRDARRVRREGGRPRDERRARARARLRARRGARTTPSCESAPRRPATLTAPSRP